MKYIIGILLVLFASYADIFLFRINIIPLQPSQFLIPLFIILVFLNYPLKDIAKSFESHTFKFLLFSFVISFIYSAFSNSSAEVIKTIIGLDMITLLLYGLALHFFKVESKKTVTMVMLFALMVLGGSIIYDFVIGLPAYDLKLAQSTRKGGFGENPNQAASGIKFLALGLLVLINKNIFFRYAVIVFMLLSIFLTFSRSGLVSVVLIIILGTMNDWHNEFVFTPITVFKSLFKLIIIFTVLFISLVALSDVIKANFPAFTRGDAGARIDLLTGKSEISINENGKQDGRALLLIKYWNDFSDFPWGHGTGYSSDKKFNRLNTHNYLLYLGINYGIITLFVFIFLLGYSSSLAIKQNHFYYFIFIILVFFECFFDHTIWYFRALTISLAFFDSEIYKKQITQAKRLKI